MSVVAAVIGFAPVAVKMVDAMTRAIGIVEASKTVAKGDDKRELALSVADQMMSVCGAQAAISGNPEVQQAMREYTSAYVKVQNAIAKAQATK